MCLQSDSETNQSLPLQGQRGCGATHVHCRTCLKRLQDKILPHIASDSRLCSSELSIAFNTKPGQSPQNPQSPELKPSETLSFENLNPTSRIYSAFWFATPRLVLLFGQTSSDDQERLDSRNRAYEGREPLPKELEESSTCCLHMKSPSNLGSPYDIPNCHGRKGTQVPERLMLNHFALAFSLGYGLDSKSTLPTLMGKLQYIGIVVTTIIISCPPKPS